MNAAPAGEGSAGAVRQLHAIMREGRKEHKGKSIRYAKVKMAQTERSVDFTLHRTENSNTNVSNFYNR
ncbi:MAG: hypothetical protein EON50_07175 [Acidovorax sp.]|nr:MAG: hypothetical protein EON50_07175 [Acidovorax sp.]